MLQVILIRREGADRVFRCIENCPGLSAAEYEILYVWYYLPALRPHHLNEVIFKTGFRKMQVDLFCKKKKIVFNFHFTFADKFPPFSFKILLHRADMTGNSDVVE